VLERIYRDKPDVVDDPAEKASLLLQVDGDVASSSNTDPISSQTAILNPNDAQASTAGSTAFEFDPAEDVSLANNDGELPTDETCTQNALVRKGATTCEGCAGSYNGHRCDGGHYAERCDGQNWVKTQLCILTDYDQQHLWMGESEPAQWNIYDSQVPGAYGWSYYIRAFDLFKEPTFDLDTEVGWGQWTSPKTQPPIEFELKYCNYNPRLFTCGDFKFNEPNCCGSKDPQKQNCGFLQEDIGIEEFTEKLTTQCGLYEENEHRESRACESGLMSGTIEGGMGYWMYTLPTDHGERRS
jgi:hypothetical protein